MLLPWQVASLILLNFPLIQPTTEVQNSSKKKEKKKPNLKKFRDKFKWKREDPSREKGKGTFFGSSIGFFLCFFFISFDWETTGLLSSSSISTGFELEVEMVGASSSSSKFLFGFFFFAILGIVAAVGFWERRRGSNLGFSKRGLDWGRSNYALI